MTLESPRPRLEDFPVEVKQAIFLSLADLACLRAFALTCSPLYQAFKNAEDLILAEILFKVVDIDVLPEASICQASEDTTDSPKFSGEYLESRAALTRKRWKFPEVALLSESALLVNYFAADFAKKALAVSPLSTAPIPSKTELNRIKRAFYRFEIFRNVGWNPRGKLWCTHPSEGTGPRHPLTQAFLGDFSPWENEQLSCVYTYLFEIVTPGFNDIVWHDVTWGHNRVSPTTHPSSLHIQALLLRIGLRGAYEFATASKLESLYVLSYWQYPETNLFLYGHVNQENMQYLEPHGQPLQSFAPELKPFFRDWDSGPADILSFLYGTLGRTNDLTSLLQRALPDARRWGFVMWDRRRLDAMGIFDQEWAAPGAATASDEQKEAETRSALRASWERRRLIYLAGGRGWWSADDESRVVWEGGLSPYDDLEKRSDCQYCIRQGKCAAHGLVLRLPQKEL